MGTWLIHDPGHSDPPYLSARWRSYCAVRAYQGPEHQAPGPGHMYFVFHSPVELVLSDSSGRSVGASATSSVNALPYAYYDAGGLTDDYDGTPDLDPTKMIYVAQPASDQYTLSATGTADGSYSAEFEIFDGNGGKTESTFVNVPISSGAAQKFAINYDSTGQTPIQVYGAFTGNLLPISDSNKFLTYASPSAALTLVSGTTAPAVIFYDSTVVSSTFSATLNGKDVSALFHPQPGTHETVMVPLQTGQNVLTLSIVGNLPSGPATDSDSLVFVLTN